MIMKAAIPCGLILEINKNGHIVRSLMDLDAEKFGFISEVEDDAGVLYLGSFIKPYIGRVDTHRLTEKRGG